MKWMKEMRLISSTKITEWGKYRESLLGLAKYYAILQELGQRKDDLATADFYDMVGHSLIKVNMEHLNIMKSP